MHDRGVFHRTRGVRRHHQPVRWRRLAAALALVAAPLAATPPRGSATAESERSADAQPALWVVSDADTTIYLFGTFHALDPRTDWFSRRVRAAFDASDALVLETLVPDDPLELRAALARFGVALPPKPEGAVASGSPTASPVAAAGQAVAAGHQAGLSVAQGADFVLRRVALSEGKPVEGLESFDVQLAMFLGLGHGSPVSTAAAPAVSAAMIGMMRGQWRRGEMGDLVQSVEALRGQSPGAYRALFADRNAAWADWIRERMKQPGTYFVAVGAGHLVGRDSVQAQLARRGLVSQRIG